MLPSADSMVTAMFLSSYALVPTILCTVLYQPLTYLQWMPYTCSSYLDHHWFLNAFGKTFVVTSLCTFEEGYRTFVSLNLTSMIKAFTINFIFISVVKNFSIPMSCQYTLVGARRDSFSDEPCGNCQRFPLNFAYFSKVAWFAVEIPSGGLSLQPGSWVLITSVKATPPHP